MPEKMCAIHADLFNSGMYNDAIWVDSMVALFGRRTFNGFWDLTLFKHGALINIKWPVHPESNMAVSCGLRSGGVRQYSNIVLLFKVAAPAHHYLLA
jgi:hypothetical protein